MRDNKSRETNDEIKKLNIIRKPRLNVIQIGTLSDDKYIAKRSVKQYYSMKEKPIKKQDQKYTRRNPFIADV